MFTADKKYLDTDGNNVWLPSENVPYELGDALIQTSYKAHAIPFRIVIGSHDRPVLQRLFGRITSRGLLHDNTVPIMIVPRPRE